MKLILTTLFVLFTVVLLGQSKENIEKAKALNSEAEALMGSRKYSSAFSKAEEASNLLEGSGSQEELRSLVNAGNAASADDNSKKSALYFGKAAALAKNLDNNDIYAYSLLSEGQAYVDLKKHDKAISTLKMALKVANPSDKDKARIYDNIGFAYYSKNDSKEAISWYEKSTSINKNLGNETKRANQLYNIGMLYSNFGDYSSAKSSLEQAKVAASTSNQGQLEKLISEALENVDNNENNETSSVTEFQKKKEEENNNYVQQMEFSNAKSMEEIESLSLENQVMELKVYAQKEEFEKQALRDSLVLVETNRQKEIELATKDAELAKTEAEKKTANAWLIGLGAAALLLLALVGIVIGNNKKLKHKNDTIAQQNSDLDKKNKNITDSINYASRIQQALMASNLVLSQACTDHFILNKPRDIVSGDFSWCDYNGKDTVLIVADCTGHGVPGALMSVLSISNVEKIVKQRGTRDPKKVLTELNNEFFHLFGKAKSEVKDGMDVVVVRINNTTKKVSFAGSRNTILVHKANELIELKGSKKHLGSEENHSEFNETELQLASGDSVYLFSDGFPDQKGGKEGKKFYPQRFREMISTNATSEMKSQLTAYEKTFTDWSQNKEQIDDVLVIGIRI